ncbi:MAG: dTDP-4-dehydrorhamnose 3,5-epimerase [Jatrophihabitans sp.]
MRVHDGDLPGILVFTPQPLRDDRGFFTRTFDTAVARDAGIDATSFVQDSQSRSHRGVVRGLHLRTGAGEAKLVRCSYGAVFDVLVDLRVKSDTFGQWMSLRLDDVHHRSVYVPAGFGHGFQALTEPADICYRIDRPHDPGHDVTVRWDDDEIAVTWPLPVTAMSARDRTARPLREVLGQLG